MTVAGGRLPGQPPLVRDRRQMVIPLVWANPVHRWERPLSAAESPLRCLRRALRSSGNRARQAVRPTQPRLIRRPVPHLESHLRDMVTTIGVMLVRDRAVQNQRAKGILPHFRSRSAPTQGGGPRTDRTARPLRQSEDPARPIHGGANFPPLLLHPAVIN